MADSRSRMKDTEVVHHPCTRWGHHVPGRNPRQAILVAVLLLLAIGTGCVNTPPIELEEPNPPSQLATAFDPDATGSIAGTVVWEGDRPLVHPFVSSPYPMAPPPRPPERTWENPNAPRIDPL